MSPPIQVFPTPSPRSPLKPPPNIHNCRWDWCRLTFPTNALLNDHVIHEHVRKAPPVQRLDLSMLRRAEEGSGESLRWSGAVSGGTDAGQPKPPTSPKSHAPTPLTSPTQSQFHPSTNAQDPSPPSPDPKPYPDITPSYSPGRTSFAQLSSLDDSPSSSDIAPDSLPASPSFNSQVANVVRNLTAGFAFGFGSRRRGRDASPAGNQSQSQASPSLISSRKRKRRGISKEHQSPEREQEISCVSNSPTSQERIERELTQEVDSDVDMGADAEDEPEPQPEPAASAGVVDKGAESGMFTAPTSTSNSRSTDAQSGLASQPHGQESQRLGDMEQDAELEWPEDIEIPNTSMPVADKSHPSLPLSQFQSQSQQPGDSQLQEGPSQSSDLSVPFVLQTQAPWYRAPSTSPTSLSRPADRQPHTPQRSSSFSHDPDRRPSQIRSQSESHNRLRRDHSFRSGTLNVKAGSTKSRDSKRGLTSQSSGNGTYASGDANENREQTDVNTDANGNMDIGADALIPQAIAESQSQSQESQDSASGSGAFKHHYLQLQTQAPYQSQSFSQSLSSETSAG